jgi:hypothetical protein
VNEQPGGVVLFPFRFSARLVARAVARVVRRNDLFEKPGERSPITRPSPPQQAPPRAESCDPEGCCCGG